MKRINKYIVQQIRNIAVSQREVAYLTPLREVKRFVSDCLESLNTPYDIAQIIAGNILAADLRGRTSHGLARLDFYVQSIKNRKLFPEAKPLVMHQNDFTGLVDGENGFGVLAARYASHLAVEKAQKSGISVVTVKGSNYCGLLSLHLHEAKDNGLLGIAMSNDVPTVLPTRGKSATIGANMLSVVAPSINKDFVLDMNIRGCCTDELQRKAEHNEKLPRGIALNSSMTDETDPKRALEANRFLPLGGKEAFGGHKGTGLAIMIDILTGALAGGNFATTFTSSSDEKNDFCHTFIVINPKFFAENFEQRLADFLEDIVSLPPADPKKKVLVPGDLEEYHMTRIQCQDGIIYKNQLYEVNNRIAQLLNIDPMKSEKICLTDSYVRN